MTDASRSVPRSQEFPEAVVCASSAPTRSEEAEAGAGQIAPVVAPEVDSRLAEVRLGIACSLYRALALKYPAGASHALRVALSCSAWGLARGMPAEERDAMEVAALLHDVGLIGVPDRILEKPGPLDADEGRLVGRARAMTLEVLRGACASPAVLEIASHCGAWYDGSRPGFSLAGPRIPLGARMITIAEAYDSMTTDHVFRPALSQEVARTELFACAGTQFDPELVQQFVDLDCCDAPELRRKVASHWLRTLDAEASNAHWRLSGSSPQRAANVDLFHRRLLDHMYDGVVFVDANFRVIRWNHGAERLTGIPAAAILQRQWFPGLMGMRNEKGKPVAENDCPVASAMESGVQSLRRLSISGRNGRTVFVDSHAIPVAGEDGRLLGVVLVLHDASPQTSLEERCQTLHEKAKLDPLTQVANRAEFDRLHAAFVAQYKERRAPFSLIICDLDHFKQVNDTYGHQAGDDAIKSLARVLKDAARPGDVVARYGGEEFVMLCANCDNGTATARAEQIRRTLGRLPQPKLGGRAVTASFGVTEVQPGDTPETMLRRADRALLAAKAKGRNTVVQLGVGSAVEAAATPAATTAQHSPTRVEQYLVTPVPITIAVEKLRGFIADHQAKVLEIKDNHVQLLVNEGVALLRRRSDRPVRFLMDLEFEEQTVSPSRPAWAGTTPQAHTRIRVSLTPRNSRDRRRADLSTRAQEVLSSFRAYLMASEVRESPGASTLRKAANVLAAWVRKR